MTQTKDHEAWQLEQWARRDAESFEAECARRAEHGEVWDAEAGEFVPEEQ